jgi:polar amino acid transport system substrate-binding protein
MKVAVQNAVFESIIPGLTAGKYDVGASSFTDTKEREKTVDFVTYANVGEAFFTKASGGTSIASLADLCGHTVAVEKGTTEQTDAETQSTKCKQSGKSGVTVLVFPDQNGANLALSSGRAQVVFADYPVSVYAVNKSNGQFKLLSGQYAAAPYGLASAKGNGLDKAMLAALKVVMKDGTYAAIFKKWGLSSASITNPKINAAVS